MSKPTRSPCDVLVAGGGFAAAAVALRLLASGFRPTLLIRQVPSVEGVEVLPATALRQLEVLGLLDALAAAGAICSDGFETAFMPRHDKVRPVPSCRSSA